MEYEQVCSVFGCGATYTATNDYTVCPACGISEHEIQRVGTNDPTLLRPFSELELGKVDSTNNTL